MKILLYEHENWPESNEDKELAKNIQLTESDKKLFKSLNEKKILSIYELKDDGIQIKASQFIGTAKFTNFTLNIIPKIFSKNKPDVWKDIVSCIYFIGDYSTSKIIEYEKIHFEDEDQLLVDPIIWRLVNECEVLIKRGLVKSYVQYDDNIPYLRGKLILRNQFVNEFRKDLKFYCQFYDL